MVLSIAMDARRATALRRVAETVVASQMDADALRRATEFDFGVLGDVIGVPGPMAEIWEIAGRPGRHALIGASADSGDAA